MEKNNGPFYGWVPRPVGILVLLLMFVPPTFSGGAYLCNISEMAGGLGLPAEDIQLASFFTSIGMCLFPPFMVRFLQVRNVRRTYLWCFLALIPLNCICATTASVPVLLTACLLTGFVRVIVMLNCTFTIAPYLTGMDTLTMFTMEEEPSAEERYALERKRTFLMPVLYFFILLISQTSNLMTAWFAYEYRWQDAYYAVVGMLLSVVIVARKMRFRTIFCLAFLLMAAANVCLYFQYQTMGLFSNMILPTVLNYTGLLMLYSLVAAFGMKSLPSRYLATFVFLMIWMRNAIAPVIGSSLYSNRLNQKQQYYVTRLSQTVDSTNPLASAAFMQTRCMGLAGGKGTMEAGQLAATSLKGRITVQATIVAMKDITGETIWLLFGTTIIVLLLPYHKGETT